MTAPTLQPEFKLQTFTARIPFVLGFKDGINHDIALGNEFVDSNETAVYGRGPFVTIRIFNAPLADTIFWPVNLPVAVSHFYAGDIGPPDEERRLYEQWVTMETPAALAVGEDQLDNGYLFHRCLGILNVFIQALGLSRSDDRLRQVSARELRPVVIIGEIDSDLVWHYVSPMLMHPDAVAHETRTRSVEVHLNSLNESLSGILRRKPFIPSTQWAARARRRRYEGDAADSVVSFQIASETLLYEIWKMLLVDEGFTSDEIDTLIEREVPFKSLLVRVLHQKLGGSWNVTMQGSAVERYWTLLYLVRNRILHSGYLPHDGDAEKAATAFDGLVTFVEERLWARHRRYPRTLVAKLGRDELQLRGWTTAWLDNFLKDIESEHETFYLPKDLAGR